MIKIVDEGFKLVWDGLAAKRLEAQAEPQTLREPRGGWACFQLVIMDEAERFMVQTQGEMPFSQNGHMRRYRVAVKGGLEARLYLEGMLVDDDGIMKADVLLEQTAMEFAPGTPGAVFVELPIPSNAAPGRQEIRVCVYESHGKGGERLAFEKRLGVDVLQAALPEPEKRQFYLDLWQHPSNLARQYGLALWSDAHFAVIRAYAASMVPLGQKAATVILSDAPWRGQSCTENQRNPSDLFEYSMAKCTRLEDGGLAFDFSVVDRYVQTMQEVGIADEIEVFGLINIWPSNTFDPEETVPGDPEPNILIPVVDKTSGLRDYLHHSGEVEQFIAAFYAHCQQMGWLKQLRIAADEPGDMPRYLKSLGRVQRIGPKFRYKTAINHAEFIGQFQDQIDDYAPNLEGSCTQHDVLLHYKRTLANKRFLWYVCLFPPHPNTFLQSPLIETRLIGLLTHFLQLDGFLRWSYTTWPAAPLQDIRYGHFSAGDLCLVYPGKDGRPLLSLRYMQMRRAAEDFERISMLKRAGETERVQAMMKQVLRVEQPGEFFAPQLLEREQLYTLDYARLQAAIWGEED